MEVKATCRPESHHVSLSCKRYPTSKLKIHAEAARGINREVAYLVVKTANVDLRPNWLGSIMAVSENLV